MIISHTLKSVSRTHDSARYQRIRNLNKKPNKRRPEMTSHLSVRRENALRVLKSWHTFVVLYRTSRMYVTSVARFGSTRD